MQKPRTLSEFFLAAMLIFKSVYAASLERDDDYTRCAGLYKVITLVFFLKN